MLVCPVDNCTLTMHKTFFVCPGQFVGNNKPLGEQKPGCIKMMLDSHHAMFCSEAKGVYEASLATAAAIAPGATASPSPARKRKTASDFASL